MNDRRWLAGGGGPGIVGRAGAGRSMTGGENPARTLNSDVSYILSGCVLVPPTSKLFSQQAPLQNPGGHQGNHHSMHYIRLLRPPSVDERNNLKLVLNITTDLSDSFLRPDKPVPISVYVHGAEAGGRVRIDDGTLSWRTGMRVLKLSLPLAGQQAARRIQDVTGGDDEGPPRIRIAASRGMPDPPHAADIPSDAEGRVLGVSAPFPRPGREPCYTATREFGLHAGELLRIHEELGESMARHIWDSGVVTIGIVADMCRAGEETQWRKMPVLRNVLRSVTPDAPVNAIELGCGVGILGIGFAAALQISNLDKPRNETSAGDDVLQQTDDLGSEKSDRPDLGTVLLTDLPDAEELTRKNIEAYLEDKRTARHQNLSLDFESLDWEDGKDGVLGPRARETGWDLIIISDCTYNTDTLSALVRTLSALHRSSKAVGKPGPRVMLSTKCRHSSENAFFDMMDSDGWDVLESASQPLPVLGSDDQTVEVYLFEKKGLE